MELVVICSRARRATPLLNNIHRRLYVEFSDEVC